MKFCPNCGSKFTQNYYESSLVCLKCGTHSKRNQKCKYCEGKDGECTDECKCPKCEDKRKPDPKLTIAPDINPADEKAILDLRRRQQQPYRKY